MYSRFFGQLYNCFFFLSVYCFTSLPRFVRAPLVKIIYIESLLVGRLHTVPRRLSVLTHLLERRERVVYLARVRPRIPTKARRKTKAKGGPRESARFVHFRLDSTEWFPNHYVNFFASASNSLSAPGLIATFGDFSGSVYPIVPVTALR